MARRKAIWKALSKWAMNMGLFEWTDKGIGKMRWYDMGLTKIAVAAFVLMLVKLWPPILGADWYWYGIIFLLAAISPLMKMFKK
ncbi:MAG: hypothetical protein V1835_03940 [Candidatus Micrarchaeota archaeon]